MLSSINSLHFIFAYFGMQVFDGENDATNRVYCTSLTSDFPKVA